jgi:hypothetical protein
MYDRSRMHRSKNNHPDLGSMSWPTDNTPREAEAFHPPPPTANRFHLIRVGSGPRHDIVASLCSQPLTANRFHLTWVGSGPRHDIAASLCSQPPTAYR